MVDNTINNEQFWSYLCNEIPSLIKQVERYLSNKSQVDTFLMWSAFNCIRGGLWGSKSKEN